MHSTTVTALNREPARNRDEMATSATRTVVSTFGLLAGLAGIEHGVGEILQGSVRPEGPVIESWPDSKAFEILGGEPALTVIPNLLVTGIAAVIVAVAGRGLVCHVRRPATRWSGADPALCASAPGGRGIRPAVDRGHRRLRRNKNWRYSPSASATCRPGRRAGLAVGLGSRGARIPDSAAGHHPPRSTPWSGQPRAGVGAYRLLLRGTHPGAGRRPGGGSLTSRL